MTKVRFKVISERLGNYHERVECAMLANGDQPAKVFWQSIASGAWPKGIEERVNPETDPVHVYYKFRARLKFLAEHGYPAQGGDINCLNDGFWEVRYDTLRIAYFDVDFEGKHTPKEWITDIRTINPPLDDEWRYPNLDSVIRLTHGFPKVGDKTEDTEIEFAHQVRREDLENG